MLWDTQDFSFSPGLPDEIERKRHLCYLEVEGDPCHQGEGWLADISQTASLLSDATCQTRRGLGWVALMVAFSALAAVTASLFSSFS